MHLDTTIIRLFPYRKPRDPRKQTTLGGKHRGADIPWLGFEDQYRSHQSWCKIQKTRHRQ